MNEIRAPRRQRLSIDLPGESEAAFRHLADRYFRGASSDAGRAAIALLSWMLRSREEDRRVIAVSADALPPQYEAPVIPGLEDLLISEWTWLVSRPHPWRRQLWIKGRKLAAGDTARTVEIEGWTPDQAADQLDLPLEAVLEAQRYLALNRALVEAEERENLIASGLASPDAPDA